MELGLLQPHKEEITRVKQEICKWKLGNGLAGGGKGETRSDSKVSRIIDGGREQ